MKLKKLLTILFLISATLGYSADTPQNQTEHVSAPQTETEPKAQEEGPAPLPSSKEMTTSYEGAFIRMLVTLLGLIFLVFATFWILRRLGGGKFKMGSSRIINVVEKRALSPKSMLYIIEVEGKKILIAESQLEVRALTNLEEPPEASD